jgi:hypothetical protein
VYHTGKPIAAKYLNFRHQNRHTPDNSPVLDNNKVINRQDGQLILIWAIQAHQRCGHDSEAAHGLT